MTRSFAHPDDIVREQMSEWTDDSCNEWIHQYTWAFLDFFAEHRCQADACEDFLGILNQVNVICMPVEHLMFDLCILLYFKVQRVCCSLQVTSSSECIRYSNVQGNGWAKFECPNSPHPLDALLSTHSTAMHRGHPSYSLSHCCLLHSAFKERASLLRSLSVWSV